MPPSLRRLTSVLGFWCRHTPGEAVGSTPPQSPSASGEDAVRAVVVDGVLRALGSNSYTRLAGIAKPIYGHGCQRPTALCWPEFGFRLPAPSALDVGRYGGRLGLWQRLGGLSAMAADLDGLCAVGCHPGIRWSVVPTGMASASSSN